MSYRGQWGPHNVDKVLHLNFFKNKLDGVMVECGSADGLTESNSKFFEEIGWKCVNIEPEPNRYKQLVQNRPSSNNLNLNYVLSNIDDKEIIFEVGPIRGNSCKGITKTFDSLMNQLNISHVDLFVLDVEGHELQVLDGINKILPKVLCIEYPWEEVGLEKLDKKLENLGYKRLFLSYNNAFYSLDHFDGPFFGETQHWDKLGIG